MLGLVLLLAVLFSVRQQRDDAQLRHAFEVESNLGDLLGALLNAEAGQREYLLAGDPVLLEHYRRDSGQLDQMLDRLGIAVRDDADQAATVDEIRRLATQKRAEMAQSLALRDEGNFAGALALIRAKSGAGLMDEIRSRITRMDQEQDRLVSLREASMMQVGLATLVTTAVSLFLMGLVALAALAEVRKGARLARFLPAEVATRLAEGDHSLRVGRTGHATVAFVDIRGSTALTEHLPPVMVTALLTTFRGAVSASASRHGGMVDKFMGDGALVVFGALDGDKNAPRAALAFAEDLLHCLASSGAGLKVGVGLHHGDVFCGIVGATERQEFTVLGDTVNVASHIEQATKSFAVDLLVSEAVLASAAANFAHWREVSREPLRGQTTGIALYTRRSDRLQGRGMLVAT